MSNDAIKAVLARYFDAYAGHDAAGCAACYTTDAWVISPWDAPVRGRDAIEQSHKAWFQEGEQDKVYNILDLSITGVTAMCLLQYDAKIPTSDGLIAVAGISLNGLIETAPDQWSITHTSLNELQEEA